MRNLKNTEVRIGNYFMDKPCCVDYEDEDVNQISKTDFEDNEFMWDRKFPIQLTHKWLIGFGFEETDSYTYFNRFYITLYDSFCKLWITDMYDVTIEYVHELQNLYFALTGEELVYSL